MSAASRLCRLAAAGSLCLAVLPASPALAQDPPRIAAGVFAGGVELGGLTADEAAARLQERLGPRLAEPVVVRTAGKRFTLAPSEAKLTFDARTTARRALAAAKPSPVPAAGGAAFGGDVPLALRHARIPVKAFAQRVAAAVARAPRDATLRIGLRKLHVSRARTGVAVDPAALAAKVDAALDAPLASRLVRQNARTVYPQTNADDLRAQYRTVVTVSKREFKLRLFKDLKLRKTYPVAIGQSAYPTPEGRYRIQDKQVNPVWSVPNSPWAGELGGTTVAGGSAANPLKARWMGIVNGVGIHGTGDDASIGSAASHGCIRMHVWHVKDLYPRVPVGAPVVIR
ncbi:MAG: L,D-transpeptidase family protein [Solirubrobacteraceae bacterium]|jgi:lipoprotein-anchoring transpeptidase ErfK/SrfK|nr:L,D-transpeptidase family protein [Solirubrobacteraceae bacterium]